ncbi:MAG: Fe-S cluster domain-containing protein [Odoribacter sp.]|nr:Fe-S cluster domain-containing protein [Odoribacter sp.]
MSTILITIISLCAIGVASAIILYFVAQKFKVEEDPRIDVVEGLLPGVNCGGCGSPGCRSFAEALVMSDTMEGLMCPVGGSPTMTSVAEALGREVVAMTPQIAVVRCNGTCENRPRTNRYDGARSCAVEHALYVGDTACGYGCLGCGDCVASCAFDAIHMNEETGLPEVVEDKCVACGACVKACPRNIIELRNKGPKDRRVYVSCVNKDKGAVARKACKVACIACTKCAKECPFDAITIATNLAYIDYSKCRLCRKCVSVCPTNAIHEVNFPPRKAAPAPEKKEVKPTPPPVAKKPEPENLEAMEKENAPDKSVPGVEVKEQV